MTPGVLVTMFEVVFLSAVAVLVAIQVAFSIALKASPELGRLMRPAQGI